MLKPTLALTALLLIAAAATTTLADQYDVSPLPVSSSAASASVDTFDQLNGWEEYAKDGVQLGVDQGVYRISSTTDGFVWGLKSDDQANVSLAVQAVPMSAFADEGFGLMCRADSSNNGNGYYFMVTGNGDYSIRVGKGDDVTPLIDWTHSDAIHTGIDQNNLRAVCAGDRLALYVNDQLVAETHDQTFTTGYVGLAVAGNLNGADIAFDNLSISTAQ